MKIKFKLLIALGLVLNITSCQQKSLQIDTALKAHQCGFMQQQLTYIDSKQQLNQLFKQSFNNPLKSLNNIDFNTHGLILVAMGQQPTTGYSVQLNNPTATFNNNVLVIDSRLIKPLKGSYNAQIITSPCALYRIKKLNIESIKIK